MTAREGLIGALLGLFLACSRMGLVANGAKDSASGGAGGTTDAGEVTDSGGGQGGATDSGGQDGASDSDVAPAAPYRVAWTRYHVCAWKTSGPPYCWGTNYGGQLGAGNQDPTLVPVQVVGLTNVNQVAVGGDNFSRNGHTCAVDADERVWCWGWNTSGQLGLGDTTNRSEPTLVPGLEGVVDVRLGSEHTCALDNQGAIWCWGSSDTGQLGIFPSGVHTQPARLATPHDAVELAIGSFHGCLRTATGEVRCWGQNALGEVGSGNKNAVFTPIVVSGAAGAIGLSAATQLSCAQFGRGAISCWGRVQATGGSPDGLTPHAIPGLPSDDLRLGQGQPCALDSSGHVWCWGPMWPDNDVTQVGARQMPGFEDIVDLSGLCGANRTGDVLCFGLNLDGEIGDGTQVDALVPVRALLP
jgi:alpha-tubulin suppressor-like RCC1 family protein